MTTVRYRLLALAFGSFVLAACGSGKPDSLPYEQLLGLVPDTPESRSMVYIIDLALMRELFDIPLPGPGAGAKEM